jgi:hypothetical protein
MKKRAKDMDEQSDEFESNNNSVRVTRAKETPEEASLRKIKARKVHRDGLNDQDRRDIFLRYKSSLVNKDFNRNLRRNQQKLRKPVTNKKIFMEELGYKSFSQFDKAFQDFLHTGSTSANTRPVGNTPLIAPKILQAAVADAEKVTSTLGGMSFNQFKIFILDYIIRSRTFYKISGANDQQFPVSHWAAEATLRYYYCRVLTWEIRQGDRAIQERLNVRNDILAWISHYCMIVAVTAGGDNKFFPLTEDKLAPRSYSLMNIDAYAVKMEGGDFDKCSGRTTAAAVIDSRDSGHGVKVQAHDSRVDLTPVDDKQATDSYRAWVASLLVDDGGYDECDDIKDSFQIHTFIEGKECQQEVGVSDTTTNRQTKQKVA